MCIYIYIDMCCFYAVPTWQLTSEGLDKGDDGGQQTFYQSLLACLLTYLRVPEPGTYLPSDLLTSFLTYLLTYLLSFFLSDLLTYVRTYVRTYLLIYLLRPADPPRKVRE